MNCVGFRNHKFFFLLVIYAVVTCIFITITMSEAVQRSVEEETPASKRFLLVLGSTLAVIMGTLMGCFLTFHIHLLMKGMTTIEFCEKSMSGTPHGGKSHGAVSYDLGLWINLKAVFGPNPFLWLLPISPAEGNGIAFNTERSLKKASYREKSLYSTFEGGKKSIYEEPEWTGNEAEDASQKAKV